MGQTSFSRLGSSRRVNAGSYLDSRAPLFRVHVGAAVAVLNTDEAQTFLSSTPESGIWFDSNQGDEPVFWLLRCLKDPYSVIGTVSKETVLRLEDRGIIEDKRYPAEKMIWASVPTAAAMRRHIVGGER